MFSLSKSGPVWTLRYEVGPAQRAVQIGAALAGLGIGVLQVGTERGLGAPTWSVMLAVLMCLMVVGLWALSDATTRVVFDLAQRRLSVHSARPWFGAPRSYAFSDVAALYAVSRSGESSDAWEARLELRDGSRIRLGRETEGRNARIRAYLEDIRGATGIKGTRISPIVRC